MISHLKKQEKNTIALHGRSHYEAFLIFNLPTSLKDLKSEKAP
jgi:hypothetical protein